MVYNGNERTFLADCCAAVCGVEHGGVRSRQISNKNKDEIKEKILRTTKGETGTGSSSALSGSRLVQFANRPGKVVFALQPGVSLLVSSGTHAALRNKPHSSEFQSVRACQSPLLASTSTCLLALLWTKGMHRERIARPMKFKKLVFFLLAEFSQAFRWKPH